jgi:predicted RNase H-like nuclease (RuvC/YqgF family)
MNYQMCLSLADGEVITSQSSYDSSCSPCAELKDLVEKSRKKTYHVHRNHQKKLKRRNAKISEQNTLLQENKQTIQDLQKKSMKAEYKVQEFKDKLDRLHHCTGKRNVRRWVLTIMKSLLQLHRT